MMLMGVGENKLPGADEELGLIPTGAWPEVVGGSGTPNPPPFDPHTDPGGRRWAGSPYLSSVPFSYSSPPGPTTSRLPSPFYSAPLWPHCGSLSIVTAMRTREFWTSARC